MSRTKDTVKAVEQIRKLTSVNTEELEQIKSGLLCQMAVSLAVIADNLTVIADKLTEGSVE